MVTLSIEGLFATFSIMALSITTFNMVTPNIRGFFATFSITTFNMVTPNVRFDSPH
jgi:hypothetical protein